VTESLKHVARPLDRERKIGFNRLIDDIAAGRRDDDAISTLAAPRRARPQDRR
jgi:type I restriction enzyme R subunit